MKKRMIAAALAAALCLSLWGCQKEQQPTAQQTTPPTTQPLCDHQFGEWIARKLPTCYREGYDERLCSICNQSETRSIPTIAHNLDEYNICRKCYEVARKHGKPIIVMEPVKGGSLVNLPDDANASPLAGCMSTLGVGSAAILCVLGAAALCVKKGKEE